MKIALLASGNLGFTIFEKLLSSEFTLRAVLTDSNSPDIMQLAEKHNIPVFKGNPRSGRTKGFIANKDIDVLISVNYLFIIEKDLINWPGKLAFNVHGSLLPKYRGRTPHVWAIINNEAYTGVTAHLITEHCDSGDILLQKKIVIQQQDTGASLLEKFNKEYPEVVFTVLKETQYNKLKAVKQDETKASYFGKRTPSDGQINWNWQKERIYNWIRAQAYPYPGAFCYYESEKVIVDQVSYDDYGFSWDMPNGLILTDNPLRVKTPNGVIVLNIIRNKQVLKPGMILK